MARTYVYSNNSQDNENEVIYSVPNPNDENGVNKNIAPPPKALRPFTIRELAKIHSSKQRKTAMVWI